MTPSRTPGRSGPDGETVSRILGRVPRRLPSWSWYTAANLATAAVIAISDWLTPSDTVVGMLLVLPIMLASLTEDRREVWLMFGLSVAAFVAVDLFGPSPGFPLWEPDRTIAFLSLPAACLVALALQRRRLELEEARRDEARSSDLNRLLMSLLAHDLRSPMALAHQALDYVSVPSTRAQDLDAELVADAQARLRRSLARVDGILSLARDGLSATEDPRGKEWRTAMEVKQELSEEFESFRSEARARGKTLVFDLSGDGGPVPARDGLVLRQALAILVDNAIRHSGPGTVEVTGRLSESGASLVVKDEGSPSPGRSGDDEGAGLGLLLCRTLLDRAGGSLDVTDIPAHGTRCRVWLPLTPTGGGELPQDGPRP